MSGFEEYVGAESSGDAVFYEVPRELHGAFGGAFGGIVAAIALDCARRVSPGRVPSALDCAFLRGVPAGRVEASARVIREGRSLTSTTVELRDEQARTTTLAMIALVDPDVLDPESVESDARSPLIDMEGATPWRSPEGVVAPIIETLAPSVVSTGAEGIATAVRIPWDAEGRGAENACIAADLSVGPPVRAALGDRRVAHPNPDLSLRFSGLAEGRDMVSIARLVSAHCGVAAVDLTVWCGDIPVAVGVSSSLLQPIF